MTSDEFFKAIGEFDAAREVAGIVMADKRFITTTDSEEMFFYFKGIYHPNAEALIKEEVERYGALHEMKITTRFVNEVINHIKRLTYIDRRLINQNKDYIHLQNGAFNIKTMELEPFNPNIISTVSIPVKYDPDADCPECKKFFSEVLHKKDIPTIQELFGCCLLKEYFIQKAFMFVGEGANGKSTLLALLKAFLGVENVSSIALQEFENNRFARGELYGKLANVFADLTDRQMRETGWFKMLTGGDLIHAPRKFKGRIRFVNHAKLCFSANKPPEVIDDTDAFFRRWVILSFPNKFEGKKAIPQALLLKKLTTEKELSGLFNWAIQGLKRLLEKGKFTSTKSTEKLREHYKLISSPIEGFIMTCCKTGFEEECKKNDLYSAFIKYCKKNRLPTKAKNKFSMDLQAVMPGLEEVKKKDERGKQQRFWRGIGLKKAKKSQKIEENEPKNAKKMPKIGQKNRVCPPTNSILPLSTYSTGFLTGGGHSGHSSLYLNNKKDYYSIRNKVKENMSTLSSKYKEQIIRYLLEYDELPIEEFKSNNKEAQNALKQALNELSRNGRIREIRKGVYKLAK